jgi:hypothetical protein
MARRAYRSCGAIIARARHDERKLKSFLTEKGELNSHKSPSPEMSEGMELPNNLFAL